MDTNFRGSGKNHKVMDSWIRGFKVFSIHINENQLFLGNQIMWFDLSMKTTKIGTPQTIVLWQYDISLLIKHLLVCSFNGKTILMLRLVPFYTIIGRFWCTFYNLYWLGKKVKKNLYAIVSQDSVPTKSDYDWL